MDATEEEFAVLEKGMREMSKAFPQSASEIAKVGEVAGQLGIAKDSIMDFTEVMVMLGDTTNLTSESAAMDIARFANITKMSVNDYERLGSTIVDLGNKSATTEADIMSMAMRMAGAGNTIGLTEAEIVSLGTALSSVGIKSERGGTAISRIMTDMQVASTIGVGRVQELEKATGKTRRELELMSSNDGKGFKDLMGSIGMTTAEANKTIKAGKQLKEFANIAGVTSEEFQKAFKEDAIGAIGMFIDGLGSAEEKGETAIEMLEDLGVNSVRLRDVLLRAGGAKELFANSIDIGNKAWEENIALSEEAEKRYATNESKLKILKNTVTDAAIELGGNLAPSLVSVVEGLVGVATSFSKLPDNIQTGTVKLAVFTTLFGGLTSLFGGFIRNGAEISRFFKTFGGLLKGTTVLSTGLGESVGATSGIMTALTSTTGLLAIGALAIVGTVGIKIANNIKETKRQKEELNELAKNIPEITTNHQEDIKYLEDIQREFDILNGLVDENGGLSQMSADEQQRYIDVVKKLKDISPDMEVFYNEQGDMIAGAKQDIQELIDLKNEEMRLDKEKAAQGFDNRLEDHGKAAKEREKKKEELETELAMRKEIVETGRHITFDGKVIEFDDAAIEKNKSRVKEIEDSLGGLGKAAKAEMSETMEIVKAKIDLMGHDFESLKPHTKGFIEGFEDMLELDSSEAGVKKVSDAMDILGETYENIQTIKDEGGVLPSISDMKTEIAKLTDLGMSYDVVAEGIYKTLAIAKRGGEDIGVLDSALAEFNKTGTTTDDTLKKLQEIFPELKDGVEGFSLDFIKQIGKTDKETAAYLSTIQKVDEGIEGLTTNIKKHVQGVKVGDVVGSEGVVKELDTIDKASKNTVKQIETDAKDYEAVLEYMYKDLGILTEAQYVEATKQNSVLAEKRIEQEKRVTEDLEIEILKRGKSSRENIKQAIADLDDESKNFNDIWNALGEDEQKLILDSSDVTKGEENWQGLIKQWMHTPEAKRLTVIDDGMEFALKNIDKLGFDWENLSNEDKVFMAEVLGIGLDEFDDFAETWGGMSNEERKYYFAIQNDGIEDTEEFKAMWDDMSDEQQEFFINLKGNGIEDAKEFVEQWKSLTDDEKDMIINVSTTGLDDVDRFQEVLKGLDDSEKELLISVLMNGTEDATAFQKRWDETLTTEEKKFIAKAVGIKDVEDADEQTMSSWATDPKMKLYQAMAEGLEEVKISKTELDGVWEVTIGDVTYKTNEEGAAEAQKLIEALQKIWNPIPKDEKKTKTIDQITNIITNHRETGDRRSVQNKEKTQTGQAYWTGTPSSKEGLAFVGEKGRELLIYPDGSHDMTGSKAELRNLPRGTIVYNNRETEDILVGKTNPEFGRNDKRISGGSNTPGFAKGTPKPNIGNTSEKAHAKAKKAADAKVKKKADDYKAEADMYQLINNQLETHNTLLAKNKILQENAKDGSARKIQLLKEEIELEIKHKKLLNDKLNLSIKERNQQRDSLKKQGFKFKGSGHNEEITNLGNIKGKSKEIEEIFDKYNELQFKTIPSIQTEIMQIASNMEKAVSDGFVQHTRNINHLVENAHYLEMNAIYQERANNDLSKKIELMKEEESIHERTAYLTRGQAKILRDERNVLEANLRKQGAIFEGSGDSRKIKEGTQNNLIQGKNKEVESQLNRWNELQFDLIPNITIDEMKLADTINNVKEKIHQASMQQLQDELDLNTKSQDDLRFKKEILSDDDLSGRLELTQKITEKEIERYGFIKSNVKELKEQLKTTKENSEEWHMINKSLDEYNQKLKDSTLELKRQKNEMVSIAQAQADKQYDSDLKNAERNIFGGQTEKDAKKVLDDKVQAFEDYISGEEKALEIAQIRKMVEEEGLTLTREQQDLLNQGGQVERDRLDRLNKQLNIQQLQAKLENQKNQKNIKQLVKKDDGTFGFEYVADKKAIKETENALLESKKDLANWELKNSLDKDKKIFEEKQKLLAVEEERLQARLKAEKEAIEAHYQAIMERQIAMMEMNMALMEQLNSEKSIKGWSETIEGIMPLMDELGINFAELMKELGIDLEDNFDMILPLLYDMGLLHKGVVDSMGIDFEKYMDAVVPVLDELGIDHKEFVTFMGVDLDKFLGDSKMSFDDYLANVRVKNLETKADVEATKDALRVPTESTHTVELIAPPPFSMPNTSSTHTVHTNYVSSEPPVKLETGGKTGSFSGGRVAMLHEKEIVLNKSQSATFEKLIDIMPNMVNTFNDIAGKFKGIAPKIPKVPTATNNSHSEETVQNFNINKLEFPNVKSADEIEKAIRGLSTFATQWANKV